MVDRYRSHRPADRWLIITANLLAQRQKSCVPRLGLSQLHVWHPLVAKPIWVGVGHVGPLVRPKVRYHTALEFASLIS